MTKDKFEQHIIEMVVKSGILLTFFSLKEFLGLNGELAGKPGLFLERYEIRKMVITAAIYKKNSLKEEIIDKFVFLKIDGCTKHRVSYLAINVQFINSKNMLDIKTLAVRDNKAQHSSKFLQHTLETVLKEFNIKKQQILAIVIDNALNMVKSVEKFNKMDVLPEVEANEDGSGLDKVFDSALSGMVDFSTMTRMRYMVHVLQLAICDGLMEKHEDRLVSKVHHIATTTRTPKIDAILKWKLAL